MNKPKHWTEIEPKNILLLMPEPKWAPASLRRTQRLIDIYDAVDKLPVCRPADLVTVEHLVLKLLVAQAKCAPMRTKGGHWPAPTRVQTERHNAIFQRQQDRRRRLEEEVYEPLRKLFPKYVKEARAPSDVEKKKEARKRCIGKALKRAKAKGIKPTPTRREVERDGHFDTERRPQAKTITGKLMKHE